MFTIIVVARLNEEMLNLKQQFFTNALDGSHVSKNNNFNDTISNFDSLNIFFRLSNDIVLQLS